jgi:tetratricopeptide (TPR) repeat protein
MPDDDARATPPPPASVATATTSAPTDAPDAATPLPLRDDAAPPPPPRDDAALDAEARASLRPEPPSHVRTGAAKTLRLLLILPWLGFLAYASYATQAILPPLINGQPLTGDALADDLLLGRVLPALRGAPLLALLPPLAVVVALILLSRAAVRDARRERAFLADHQEWENEYHRRLGALRDAENRRQAEAARQRAEAAHQRLDEATQRGGLGTAAAAAPAGPPLDFALLPEPEHFVGREADLAWVEERLRQGGTAAIVAAIAGLGGIGKTALAAVAARRLYAEGRFPDGVAVISCLERDDAPGVLRDVLLRFIPQDVPPSATPAALATLAVARLRGRDALVVLDNVEPELALAEVLQPLRDAGLTVLITARQTLPLPPDARRALDLLPDAAALDLFAEWYGRSTAAALSPAEAAAARRIVTALGNHTLAVKLAGAQAADLALPLEQFAAQVAAHPLDLEGQGADATLALKENLLRSVTALPASGDLGDVRRLFTALAAVATPEFGRRAATALGAALALPDPGRALDLLLRRALLDADHAATLPDEEEEGADADRERLRLHPLLRELAAERLDAPTRATAALALARFYAAYSNETSDPALVPDAANIAGAIEWAHEQAADDEAAAQALVRMCLGMQYFWRDRSRTRDSLRYLPWGLAAAERLATPGARDDQLTIGYLQLSYATALITAGRLPEAEEYLNRSLAIRRAVGDTRGEGVALSKLGDLLVQRGDLAGAQANYERVLAIMRDVGDTHEEGVALGKLGDILVQRGDLAGAQANYERVLAIMRDVGDTRGEGVALGKLGDILVQRGDLAGAQANYERYRAIMRDVGDTREEGVALGKLGQTAQIRGQMEEAETYYRGCLDIMRAVGDSLNEGMICMILGEFLITQRGKRDEGCVLLNSAIRIFHEMGVPQEQDAREKAQRLGCDVEA